MTTNQKVKDSNFVKKHYSKMVFLAATRNRAKDIQYTQIDEELLGCIACNRDEEYGDFLEKKYEWFCSLTEQVRQMPQILPQGRNAMITHAIKNLTLFSVLITMYEY